MRATKLVLVAITAGALLGTTACGGTVTIRPASGSTPPTSDITISGQTTAGVAAEDGSGAGITIRPDGVTVRDGSGAGYSTGPNGVTVDDGQGNGFSTGPDGVTVRTGPTRERDPNAGAGASDLVTFCGQATRFGAAHVAMLKSYAASGSSQTEKFAASLATMIDALAQMSRTGPPALQADLATLTSATTAIQDAYHRNGGDLVRLDAEGSVIGIGDAARGAYDRANAVAVDACG
jgi:hypothetical protein